MTDRPDDTSGATPPRPDDAAVAEPPADVGRAAAARPEDARREAVPHRSGFGWIAVIVLIIGGVAAAPWWAPAIAPLLPWAADTMPAPQPAASQDATNRRIDALGQRLTEIEQRLGQLAQRPAPDAAAADAALAPLRDAVQREKSDGEALAKRVAAIEQRPAAAPPADPAALADLRSASDKLGTAVAALEQRVGTLASKSASDAAATVDPALLLSLGQLRQALRGSGPYAAELATATTLAASHPDVKAALAPLADSAERGVPGLAVLRQRFDGLAGSIADAGASTVPADDWSGQLLGRLRGLVTVRRVGPGAAGDGPEGIVAQAESALARDDLAGAVAALETLHGPPRLAAREWLETAHRRQAVEAALDAATALVTTHLAADRKSTAPDGAGANP